MKAMIDNMIVVSAFNKTRSNVDVTNQILIRIFEILRDRNIHLRVVWIPTAVMAEGGADDLSRGSYQEFQSYIRISTVGWFYIKKHFPAPHHLVFGYPVDAEENDDITFSSFHQEDCASYNGVDPFTHLAKALDKKALTGTQVLLPAKNMIEKTVQVLENIQHQHMCSFLFIVPSSQLFMIKWRLRNKLNLGTFKFQGNNKKTKLTSRTREEYFCISFGSSLAKV